MEERRADDVRAPISVLPGTKITGAASPCRAKRQGAPGLSRRAVATAAESRSRGPRGAVILQSRASGAVVSQREAEQIGPIEGHGLPNGTAGCLCWTTMQLCILVYASQHHAEQQLVQLCLFQRPFANSCERVGGELTAIASGA
jgi:hypothetical protein